MEKKGILYRSDRTKRLADNALVALTLMIAESKSDEKEMMVKVMVNLVWIKLFKYSKIAQDFGILAKTNLNTLCRIRYKFACNC